MNPALQTLRAHMIHLCTNVMDACSLTDIEVLKTQARLLLEEMGVEKPSESFDDLL